MGSTRLPGKSAMTIHGKPLIWHVLRRVKQARGIDAVALATPQEENSPLAAIAEELEVPTLAPDIGPNDLIRRYAMTSQLFNAATVVRVPGDNPCVDPEEIERILAVYRGGPAPTGCWLTTNLNQNVLKNGYPGGLGAEVYDAWFIHWLNHNVEDPREREHPHLWAFNRGRVRTVNCPAEIRRPDLRFDVNDLMDFDFITSIYDALYPENPDFRSRDIMAHLEGGKRWQTM